MKRYASDVMHELQVRIARLERLAAKKKYTDKDIETQYERAGRLSNVDPDLAKLLVEKGDRKSDKISVKRSSGSASKLKPSQTTMVLEKSLGMAIGVLLGKMSDDMGAIVSADNHILDGHHRWSAWVIAKGHENPKVGYYKAELSGSMLIRVLNVATKGFFPTRNGNAGSGDISEYTPKNLEVMLRALIANGISGKFPVSSAQIKKALEDNYGSVEKGVTQMKRNISMMSKEVPAWAPDRKDMPVIEPNEVPDVAGALTKGEVEWKPPYPAEIE